MFTTVSPAAIAFDLPACTIRCDELSSSKTLGCDLPCSVMTVFSSHEMMTSDRALPLAVVSVVPTAKSIVLLFSVLGQRYGKLISWSMCPALEWLASDGQYCSRSSQMRLGLWSGSHFSGGNCMIVRLPQHEYAHATTRQNVVEHTCFSLISKTDRWHGSRPQRPLSFIILLSYVYHLLTTNAVDTAFAWHHAEGKWVGNGLPGPLKRYRFP